MERRKTPEEIRAERIANLKDPEARAAIDKIEKERAERLTELRTYQWENFDKWLDQVTRQREQSLNGPQLTPPGMKDGPVIDKPDKQQLRENAKAEVYRQTKGQERAINMPFDRRVDRELDAADRRQERQQGHILHKGGGPDRNDH